MPRFLEPHYAWLALGIALLILYGSFYPFGFYAHHDPRGPLGVLLASHLRDATRDDVTANIFLYFPLGFFVALALQRRILAAVACGVALSLFVELGQFYDLGRYQQLSDVAANTLGALLGAAVARAVVPWLSSLFPALLLACWLGSRVYPTAQPTSAFPVLDLLCFFAEWLAAAVMIEALWGAPRSRVALPLLFVATLLLRAIVIFPQITELAGGIAATVLWSAFLWRMPARASLPAILLTASLVLLALAPFHFLPTPRAFGWIPFRSSLAAPTEAATRVFLEKIFQYGGLLWLLARSGWSAGVAAAFGTLLVFALRLLQVYLPSRSAEITDAFLVLMLAVAMQLISRAERATPAPR